MGLVSVVVSGKAVDRPGLKEALADALLAGIPLRVAVTTESAGAEGLVREAVEAGAQRVVVVGGDGTVHEAFRALLEPVLAGTGPARAELGVVPGGTANDFATLLGALSDPVGVWLERALRAPAHPIDAGLANGVPFANMVTLGPGAQVSEETPDGLKRALGKVAYVAKAVGAAARLEPVDVVVRGPDGVLFEGPAAAVCIANGRQVGGGLRVSPDSDLGDGLLDLLVVPQMSLAGLGVVASSAFLGQLDALQGLVRVRAAWFEVSSDRPFACSLDGVVGEVDRVRAEALPRALALAGFGG